ncbi:hypothetical protein FB45DRAFT_474348 [Roridomyces roridus]|uniref:Uncharacterized protein n=1 Tax=Roridomyces roridus TaxID=1738132 RepID=A0AAD7BZ71_9AGAR|nr:hypothetical protein FB45DRAFT_474348 [Roridomyces roridus]
MSSTTMTTNTVQTIGLPGSCSSFLEFSASRRAKGIRSPRLRTLVSMNFKPRISMLPQLLPTNLAPSQNPLWFERTADVGVCPNLPPTPREVSSTIKSVPTAAYDPPVAQQSATTPKPATSTGQPRPSGTAPQSLRPFLWNFFKWAVVLPAAGVVSTILCFVVFPYPAIVFDDQPPPPPLNVPELPPPAPPPPPAPVAPQHEPVPPPALAYPPPLIPPALDAPQPVTAPPPALAPPPQTRRDAGLKLLGIITPATTNRLQREEGPENAALHAELLVKIQRRVLQRVVTRAAMLRAPENVERDNGAEKQLQMIQKLVSKSAASRAARLSKEEEKIRVERIEEVQRRLWWLRAELKEGET